MDKFMKAAIAEAKKGLVLGGIPIGSVLVKKGKIIGRRGRAPIVSLREANRLRKERELLDIFRESANWSNHSSILASRLIKFSAEKGIPIDYIKENFLRRMGNAGTIVAINKQLSQLGKKKVRKK